MARQDRMLGQLLSPLTLAGKAGMDGYTRASRRNSRTDPQGARSPIGNALATKPEGPLRAGTQRGNLTAAEEAPVFGRRVTIGRKGWFFGRPAAVRGNRSAPHGARTGSIAPTTVCFGAEQQRGPASDCLKCSGAEVCGRPSWGCRVRALGQVQDRHCKFLREFASSRRAPRQGRFAEVGSIASRPQRARFCLYQHATAAVRVLGNRFFVLTFLELTMNRRPAV